MNRETKRPRITRPIEMRIVGAEHRVSKTVKVEKAKQEDLTVSTRTDRDGNKDTGISVI